MPVYIHNAQLKQLWVSSASIVLFPIVISSFVLQFIATPFLIGGRLQSLQGDHLTKKLPFWFYP